MIQPVSRSSRLASRALALALLGALLLSLGAALPARAATRSLQQVVSDNTNSLRVQVAADSANNLHIVWYDGADDERSVKYAKGTATASGYSWSGPIVIYQPGGAPTFINPRIAIDNADTVHVVWSWKSSGPDQVYYQRWPAAAGPGQSSGPQVLGNGLLPAVATDAGNRVHVVWETPAGGNFEILYRVGDGSNFSGAENISNNGGDSLSPDIAIDASSVPNVVWYDKSSGAQAVLYSRRTADGWTPGQGLSAPDSVFPSIAADAQGCVHVAWNEVSNSAIVYRKLCNGEVNAGRVVSTGNEPRRPAVGSNAQGNLVVAWDAKPGRVSTIFYATLINGAWSGQQQLAATGNNQLWTDASGLRNGQVAVVWQENIGNQFDPSAAVVNVAPAPPAPAPAPPAPPAPAPAPPTPDVPGFANDAFRALWTRTDSLVQQGAVSYSWIWGPGPFSNGIGEYYVQSPNQVRQVQYFDKSRMEINQPDAPRGPFYVTNGRLTDELITGKMQVGDAQYEQRSPAAVAVGGDPDNTFPLYSDLAAVYRQPGGDRANQAISRAADGGVQISERPQANADPGTIVAQRVAGIAIPRVFWDYMNRSGRVAENGRTSVASPLFDWRYVIGEPLTAAYWTTIKVGGQQQDVLVQAFERRVLTYTPANPDAYKVEMGNIGRHYFTWRYGQR